MRFFKNQAGTSDIVAVSIILGMIGAIFITGFFVWQEIDKSKKIVVIEKNNVVNLDNDTTKDEVIKKYSKFIHIVSLDPEDVSENAVDFKFTYGGYENISKEDHKKGIIEHYVENISNDVTSESFSIDYKLFNTVKEAKEYWQLYRQQLQFINFLGEEDDTPKMSALDNIKDEHIYYFLDKEGGRDIYGREFPNLKLGGLVLLDSNAVFEILLELKNENDEQYIKDIFYNWYDSLYNYQVDLDTYIEQLVDLQDYCEFIESENRWNCFLYNVSEVENMTDEQKKKNGKLISDLSMSCHNLENRGDSSYAETANGTFDFWCSLKFDDGLSECSTSEDCQGFCSVYKKSDNGLFLPELTYSDWFNYLNPRYDFNSDINYYKNNNYKFACTEFYLSPCALVLKIDGEEVNLAEDCHYEVKTTKNEVARKTNIIKETNEAPISNFQSDVIESQQDCKAKNLEYVSVNSEQLILIGNNGDSIYSKKYENDNWYLTSGADQKTELATSAPSFCKGEACESYELVYWGGGNVAYIKVIYEESDILPIDFDSNNLECELIVNNVFDNR